MPYVIAGRTPNTAPIASASVGVRCAPLATISRSAGKRSPLATATSASPIVGTIERRVTLWRVIAASTSVGSKRSSTTSLVCVAQRFVRMSPANDVGGTATSETIGVGDPASLARRPAMLAASPPCV